MVAITVTEVNHEGYTATFRVTGLVTTKAYDVMRILEAPVRDNERRYQVVAHRLNWVPGAADLTIRDYEASIRPYRLAVYDSAYPTPADWDFSYGPYAGYGPLAVSDVVTINPPACGAILRSSIQPGFWLPARIWDFSQVEYPARTAEHKVIGNRFPVFINDRREGRSINELVLYTPTMTESMRMADMLIPESGRIYPLWLRTSTDDHLLFSDLFFMPHDISIEPVSKAEPWRRWIRMSLTEIDARTLVPRRDNDGTTANPPTAVIGASTFSGKAPLTVTFADESLGTVTSRRWDFNTSSDTYGTSTDPGKAVTYKKKGTYTVRLDVSGPLGADSTTVKVVVT
jgi:hypothetical protein